MATTCSLRTSAMLDLLLSLQQEIDRNPGRDTVNTLVHSLQVAENAARAQAGDELVFVALVHDACRILAPANHGEAVAELVRDRVSVDAYMVLRTHGLFQAALMHKDDTRTRLWQSEPWYPAARALAQWEERAFDPHRSVLALKQYVPLVERVLGDR